MTSTIWDRFTWILSIETIKTVTRKYLIKPRTTSVNYSAIIHGINSVWFSCAIMILVKFIGIHGQNIYITFGSKMKLRLFRANVRKVTTISHTVLCKLWSLSELFSHPKKVSIFDFLSFTWVRVIQRLSWFSRMCCNQDNIFSAVDGSDRDLFMLSDPSLTTFHKKALWILQLLKTKKLYYNSLFKSSSCNK
jgi:hypothetical protein